VDKRSQEGIVIAENWSKVGRCVAEPIGCKRKVKKSGGKNKERVPWQKHSSVAGETFLIRNQRMTRREGIRSRKGGG